MKKEIRCISFLTFLQGSKSHQNSKRKQPFPGIGRKIWLISVDYYTKFSRRSQQKFNGWLSKPLLACRSQFNNYVSNHKRYKNKYFAVSDLFLHISETQQFLLFRIKEYLEVMAMKRWRYTAQNIKNWASQGLYGFKLLFQSSSSCRVASTDIPDPLSPLLPIVHRLWQVFRATSHILT